MTEAREEFRRLAADAERGTAADRAVAGAPAGMKGGLGGMAGYSTTPLPRKLGIKAGHSVALFAGPEELPQALQPLPEPLDLHADPVDGGPFDVILFFSVRLAEVEERFAALARRL